MALPVKKKAVTKKKASPKKKAAPKKKTENKGSSKASGKPTDAKSVFKVTVDAKKKWKKARAKAAEGKKGFEDDEVSPGNYLARLTRAQCGTTKKGDLYASFNFVITSSGDYEGSQLSCFYDLTGPGNNDKENRNPEFFAKQLQGFEIWDVTEFDLEDVPVACAELTKQKPEVRVNVVHNESGGKTYQGLYVNGPVTV